MNDETDRHKYHHILTEIGALRAQMHNFREFVGERFNELAYQQAQTAEAMRRIMLDISQIQQNIADLNTKVAAEKTVEDGAVVLLQGMTASLLDLQAQIAALNAKNLQQADLDNIAAQIGAVANTVNSNTNSLASAVAAVPPPPTPAGQAPASNPPTPSTGTPSSDTPSTPA